MSEPLDTRTWLRAREPRAPQALLASMQDAIATQPADSANKSLVLAQSALSCLEQAIALGNVRAAAFPLLSADALLTHACEAAAESGEATLDELCGRLDVQRFAKLLTNAP